MVESGGKSVLRDIASGNAIGEWIGCRSASTLRRLRITHSVYERTASARRSVAPGILLLALLLGACTVKRPPIEPQPPAPPAALSADQIRDLLAQDQPILIAGEALMDVSTLRAFYAARGYQSAFTGADCAERIPAVTEAIRLADMHGLSSVRYHARQLSGTDACAPDNELLASDAWLVLAQHLHAGSIDPRKVEPDWTASRPLLDRAALLEQALASNTLAMSLAALAPQDGYYRALQTALTLWRERQARSDWPSLDDGPTLRRGDQGPRVAQMRALLAIEGFVADPESGPDSFDAELERQVKQYQTAAHLDVDGAVGRETLAELRRTPTERVAQLCANLERWRWLPDTLGERHIRVNIPHFQLEARSSGKIERVHRIIVGKQLRRTPSFSASMRYIVVNPWWEVPRRLAVEDKLPLFQRDPEAFARLGFRAIGADNLEVDPAGIDWNTFTRRSFPFRLRQQPGRENALGEVKLMFPNRHDVYLHDTPGRTLFERSRRNFSSGCMRTEFPLELAAWALSDNSGWPLERLTSVAAGDAETTIRLKTPIPVHVQYLTAVVDEGEVRFVYDLYQRDAALIEAMGLDPT